MQLILSHHLSSTSCWASPQSQHVWRNMAIHASSLRLVVLKDAKFYMTVFYKLCNGTEFRSFCLKSFHLSCLMFLTTFLPRRQSWPSNLVRERTIVLFVSDHRTSLLVPVCHDWNNMSLILNIVHVSSTENTLPLSSQRRLSFLFWLLVTDPRSTTSLQTLKFPSVIIWRKWSFTTVINMW